MRNFSLIALLLLLAHLSLAQDPATPEEIVQLTIDAIHEKSTAQLEPHLAADFTIAGQEGPIAVMVLQQLTQQLGEKVLSRRKISSSETDGHLTLTYEFAYQNMGKKETIFKFNPARQLKALTLFEMEVKTMQGDQEIAHPEDQIIRIPFKMVGNLISVDVTLNGVTRPFILDSGSPRVILNAKYLEDKPEESTTLSTSQGVGGAISGMNISKVEHLDWHGIELRDEEVITLDLAHLETQLETDIYGLIGADMLQRYDVLFDYDKTEITLIQPDKYPDFQEKEFKGATLTPFPIQLTSHIPVFEVLIGGEKMMFGLDCGAESNLISETLFEQLRPQMSKLNEDKLIGADNNPITVRNGQLKNTTIAGKDFKKMRTLFSDISHLNAGYGLQIDGLIGYEVLKQQKTLVSFARKEMIFIE